jgi:DNA-binding HxlR family transcriptional regulator
MDELQSISTIKQIPSKLFHPYRLLILIDLKLSGVLRFNKIRDDIGLSDGNLAGHLRALEQEGYIKSNTILEKRRLKSCIEITQEGLKVLEDFSEQLKSVMKIISKN